MSQASESIISLAGASVVITLVHGTWATGAPWTKFDSPFCNQLCKELRVYGVKSIQLLRFDWSGRNSHRDRRIASIQLRRQLLVQFASQPYAHHYVVAHSHGGNVALRAVCHSSTLRRELKGIVAISTPFLTFVPKSIRLALLRPTLRNATLFMVGAPLAGLLYVLEYWVTFFRIIPLPIVVLLVVLLVLAGGFSWHIHQSLFSWYIPFAQVWSAILGILSAAVLLWFGWKEAKEEISEKLQREKVRVIRRYGYSQPEARLTDMPVLAMSSLIDEAYGVLVGSWWMHRATGWGIRIGIFVAIGLSIVLSAAVVWAFVGVLGLEAKGFDFKALVLFSMFKPVLQFVVWVPSCLAIAVAYLLVELFLAISGRSEPGLGLANPDENLVCEVRAKRTLSPPIRSTNKRYGTWQLLCHAKGVLFHSRIYFYHPAIRDMAEWIIYPDKHI